MLPLHTPPHTTRHFQLCSPPKQDEPDKTAATRHLELTSWLQPGQRLTRNGERQDRGISQDSAEAQRYAIQNR